MTEQPDWIRVKIAYKPGDRYVTVCDAESGRPIKGVMAIEWHADERTMESGAYPATLKVLCELDLEVPGEERIHARVFSR